MSFLFRNFDMLNVINILETVLWAYLSYQKIQSLNLSIFKTFLYQDMKFWLLIKDITLFNILSLDSD